MSNEITGFLAEARKKLSDLNGISGQKERAMAPFVRDKLLEFCDQDAEFAQAETLRLYRAQTSRGASLGRLIENQWSADAALGYAAMGMQAAEIRPDQGVLALDAMMEAMEHFSLDEARAYERGLRESDAPTEARDGGDGGRPVTAPTETRDAEMPRVVGPSAEFVPEGWPRE
jgi:hypothetical protein